MKHSYASWVKTRNAYQSWFSKFLLTNRENKSFIYKEFNLLHITLLAKKDSKTNNEWLTKIHLRLNGVEIKLNRFYNKVYFFCRIYFSFWSCKE